MSIMGRHVPGDTLYPTNALFILKAVKEWLDGNREGGEFTLEQFHQFLVEMKNERPFSPGRFDSREPPLLLSPEEGFKCRRPVWQLFHDQFNRSEALIRLPFREQVAWLIEQVAVCDLYGEYEAALKNFRTKVEKLGLSFHSGDSIGSSPAAT